MGYAELHCHSNFSFRDGASWAEDLVARAIDLEYEALAITDHHGFYGAARMHMAALESGLPVVYGTEITLPQPGERFEKKPKPPRSEHKRGRIRRSYRDKPDDPPPGHHLVLLASDPASYAALGKLVTAAQRRGQKEWPIYDWEDLSEAARSPDIVAMTGCWQGAVPAAASQGDMVRARREASRLADIFGDRLFIELWDHRMPGDDERNEALYGLAAQLGLGMVATNNVHYHDRSEADLSEVLAAIGGRRNLDAADGFRPATDERYLKAPELMRKRFARYPGAVETAAELGRAMAFDLKLVAPRLPDFPMPGHFQNEMAYLRHLTYEGAKNVYGDGAGGIEPAAKARLDHELQIIDELGFPGYFLVVWDLVQFARGKDIYCQIRGSGADSAVCRCIGLTRVDPIRLGLPFERFLSEERGKPPDIDVDFEAERREEVIQYCYQRYGRERAAMVANVITYRARSVLQDVGKSFGLTQAQVNAMTKYLDTHNPAVIAEQAPLPAGLTAELIYDTCMRLDGFPRHLGIHSGGMVIADRPLYEVVPIEWGRMEDRTVLQWDKDDCAAMGIVKFDLLALGMLNALHIAADLIAETHGVTIDLATIPQEPVIYEMMTKADTVGLFQVESRAQMATLPRMKPKTFYDLAIEVALIRPGPIQGESVHPYLRRRNGEEPVRYPHPSTEPILKKTLGVPIFQEQLMELARVCAGFSGGQTDRLRSAMSNKRSEEAMARLRDELFEGMERNGVVGEAAEEIWQKLQGFSSFGFPESHSVSFAYIVYASAWLRFHWPSEFLAGLLNAQPMGFYSPNSLVLDAQRHGVVVLAPDINLSAYDCTLEYHETDPDDVVSYFDMQWRRGRGPVGDPLRPPVAVRLGLRYVRNLGDAEVGRIEVGRDIGGPFVSLEDLGQRVGLGEPALETLSASGALAPLGIGRREGLWAAGSIAELGPGRLALAAGADAPSLDPMDEPQQLAADLWSTGVSNRHPMQLIRDEMVAAGYLSIADALTKKKHGIKATVAGVVTHRQRPGTANGVRFLNLEDETGLLNVVVLPAVWDAHLEVARKSSGLIIDGVLEYRDGVTNLVAHRIVALNSMPLQSRDFR